jgi:hypothetical protein
MALDLARYGRRIEQIPNIVFGVACWWHMGSGGRGGQVQVCVAMPSSRVLTLLHRPPCYVHVSATNYSRICVSGTVSAAFFTSNLLLLLLSVCREPGRKPEPIYRFRDQDRKFLSFATMKQLQLAPCPVCNVDGNLVVN